MTGDEPTGHFSLRALMTTAIAVWVVAFWLVYGPMVLAYLFLHAATTGVFLAAIRRSDRNRVIRQVQMQAIHISPQPSRERQNHPANRAVAS